MPASPAFPAGGQLEGDSHNDDSNHLDSSSRHRTSAAQPRRRRVDSLSSVGSSVAPAAPPYRTSKAHRKPTDSGGRSSSSAFRLGAAYKSPTGDGLDNWLQSQTAPTGAPADRISRRHGGSEAGSLHGGNAPSIGAWSAGVRSASGRKKRRDPSAAKAEEVRSGSGSVARQIGTSSSLRPMPDFDDPPTYSQPHQRHGSGQGPLDSLQEWRETSAVVTGAAPEPRSRERTHRAVPAGSHSPESTVVGVSRHRRPRADREGSASAVSSSNAHPSISFTPFVHRTTAEPSPLRRIIRWLAKLDFPHTTSQRRPPSKQTILVLFFVCGIVRWGVGLGSWSGRGVEPMHGDFEAQRHWLELTYHLPTSQWYFYDLPYWGLDYPPLTAWHSLLCSKIGNAIPTVRPSLALFTSRGAESPALVTFMRATVLISDYLTFLPAVLFFLARRLEGRGRRTYAIAAMSVLLQPSLVLIDHGHFQYNCVMLGLSTLAFACLYTSLPNPNVEALPGNGTEAELKIAERKLKQRVTNLSRRVSYDYVFAAVAFTFSLGFKQMALFYAPAIFAVMVGRCWGLTQAGADRGLALFSGLAMWTIVAFLIQFHPWLSSLTQMSQIVHRVFPLARGIFEDKVSNAWCFLSVLPVPARWKLKNMLSVGALARLSTLTTLVAIIPPCVHLFLAGVETVRTEMALVDDAKKRAARRQSVSAGSRRAAADGASVSTALHSPSTPAGTPSRGNSTLAALQQQTTPSSRRRTRSIAAGSEGGQSELGALLSHSGLPLSQSARLDAVLQERERAQQLASRPVASSSPSPAALVLPYALLSTSLAFYLFGFQTHEKTVLLPLLPLSLLMGAKGDEWGEGAAREDWEWGVLGNNIAVFSMFPLLQRDGLSLQYVTLTLFWNWAIGYRPFSDLRKGGNRRNFVSYVSALLTLAMLGLHALEVLLPRLLPAFHASLIHRYPDLWAVLNVLLCAPALGLIWAWSMLRQVQVGFACGVGLDGVKWISQLGARLEAKQRERDGGKTAIEGKRWKKDRNERDRHPPLPSMPAGDANGGKGSSVITAEAAAGI